VILAPAFRTPLPATISVLEVTRGSDTVALDRCVLNSDTSGGLTEGQLRGRLWVGRGNGGVTSLHAFGWPLLRVLAEGRGRPALFGTVPGEGEG
jgi:hypothetical protein